MCRPSHRRAAIKGPGDFPERRASASLFSLRVFWALNPTAPWLLWATGLPWAAGLPWATVRPHAGSRPGYINPTTPYPVNTLSCIHCSAYISTSHNVSGSFRRNTRFTGWTGPGQADGRVPREANIWSHFRCPHGPQRPTLLLHPSQPAARERGAAVLLPLPCPLSLEVLQADQIRWLLAIEC